MVVCVFVVSLIPIDVSVVLIYFSHVCKTYRCISSAGVCIPTSACLCVCYRVATISRLLKITSLFCKRAL